ncbi:MAG: hypothetical protein HYV37_00825 [Candidatus Levyibacteriota bacterium]|nr:MAG: hypothetical protein HYV37_00825 [Candidatus Levybacteria bacterium]
MRTIFFIIFMIIAASGAFFSFTDGDYLYLALNVAGLVGLWFTNDSINKILRGSGNSSSLTESEKTRVMITEITTPVIAGAFYYYSLKNKFPKKASEANKYSWIIFAIMSVGYFAYMFLTGEKL